MQLPIARARVSLPAAVSVTAGLTLDLARGDNWQEQCQWQCTSLSHQPEAVQPAVPWATRVRTYGGQHQPARPSLGQMPETQNTSAATGASTGTACQPDQAATEQLAHHDGAAAIFNVE